MFCKNCGKELTEGARFCRSCGMAVSSVSGTAPQPEPVQDKAPTADPGLTAYDNLTKSLTPTVTVPEQNKNNRGLPKPEKLRLGKGVIVLLLVTLIIVIGSAVYLFEFSDARSDKYPIWKGIPASEIFSQSGGQE